MKRISRKYVFNSKEQFETKVSVFKDTEHDSFTPNFHHFAEVGHELLEPREIDENGEVIKESVYSDKYLVDAAWFKSQLKFEDGEYKCPYGWATYKVTPKAPLYIMRGLEKTYE